jgi:hypothetical protein
MNTSLNHGSAKIYQFPPGGRAALGGHRYGETKPTAEASSPHVDTAALSGSWYHEAAIQAAMQDTKPAWER